MFRLTIRALSLSTRLVKLFGLAILSLVFISPVQTNAQPNSVYFSLGPGFTDVTTRQIIRTADDRVFIFAARAQYTTVLVGYWTTLPGIPTTAADFNGTSTITEAANIISVDAVYDGSTTIHVFVNLQNGQIRDYPFNTATNAFNTPITLATDGQTVVGDYIGTAGIGGMVDFSGQMHLSYHNNTNNIIHHIYTYASATNTLTPVGVPFQVNTAANANHPIIAVAPNNSVVVAWVSEAGAVGSIFARERSAAGVWGAVETVSTSDVWTSTIAGINIDQGPSFLIDSAGVRHIVYIEDYDSTGDYGRVHYASSNGGAWTDVPVTFSGVDPQTIINGNTYSHNPALSIDGSGQLYIIGHGPMLTAVNNNMYTYSRNTNGTWTVPTLFATGNSFDASPSVKWAAIGNNRPYTHEFAFFLAPGGAYSSAVLHYGRFGDISLVPPIGTPTATPTQTPIVPSSPGSTSSTPTAVSVLIDVFDPAISKIGFLRPGQTGVTGETLEWVVTVTNRGTGTGQYIVISDDVPSSLRVDEVRTPVGAASINGQIVTVTITSLAPSESVQFSIFTTVLQGTTVDNIICLTASNLSETRCALGRSVSSLPSTGERAWWRRLLSISIMLNHAVRLLLPVQ